MSDLRKDCDYEYERVDDIPTNPSTAPKIGDIITARLSRRGALKGLGGGAVAGAAVVYGAGQVQAMSHGTHSSLGFTELAKGYDEAHAVAEGYEAQTLIRWGDPVVPGAPAFDPNTLTAETQLQQFGYNCDYVGYLPLPLGSDSADHGLLCVNHEYTNAHLMWSGVTKENAADVLTKEQAEVEMAAHGHAVVEIRRSADGKWSYDPNSTYNRRISALTTELELTGPAAGSDRLKTSVDPTGTKVIGTINNCAGGKTPWGTVTFAEENFHGYFTGNADGHPEEQNYKRYGVPGGWYVWGNYHSRFDINKEPNEPNRFGWIVEFDPYDPNSVPKKRTALGRFKHEGANTIIDKSGRAVVYMGDDQRFDYIYKFVSNGTYNPDDRAANMNLLDDGVLYVAQFDEETLTWLPLVFGEGPLTAENGFNSQADVLIETRRAADLLGATPMDRPEDVEPNPVNGCIYAMLTNNTRRKEANVVNPRVSNAHGHVLEMIPPGTTAGGSAADADHTATEYTWSLFVLGGSPAEHGGMYHPAITENGWFSSPDNVAFDKKGRIWISTDGSPKFGFADGVWAADVSGEARAMTKLFYRCPTGAEHCGPEFNTDDSAYFVAVQHPADDSGSTFDTPSTRWPDFVDGVPPRPSVQVIVKTGGGTIGDA